MPAPPSYSPVLRQATELAHKAASEYVKNGTDPSATIAKFGDQLYSPAFTHLVVSRANQEIFKHVRAGDRRGEYPVALPAKVKEAMQPSISKAATDTRVSPVWNRDRDWLDLSKLAVTHRDDRGREVNTMGVPVKIAAPAVNNADLIEGQLQRDYWTAKHAADLEKQAAVEEGIEFVHVVEAFRDYVKTAARKGEPVFETAFNVAANCEPEKKASVAALADWCVNTMARCGDISKEAFEEYQQTVKTAALDWLDNGYPVMRGGDKLVLQLNTMVGAMERREHGGGERYLGGAGPGSDDNYYNPGGDDRMKYRVEGAYKPRESQPLVQRDATIRGLPLF